MSRPSRPPSPAPRVVNVPIPPPDAKSGFDWLIEAVFRPRDAGLPDRVNGIRPAGRPDHPANRLANDL
jgi:hypothetical protein